MPTRPPSCPPRVVLIVLWVMAFGLAPTPLIAKNDDDRTIEFVNMCPSTVRIGVNGGSLLDRKSGNPIVCDKSAPCPDGSTCYIAESATSGHCFFNFPAPTSGGAVLSPAGSKSGTTATYVLTNPPWIGGVSVKGGVATTSIKWSGNVYAAANCDSKGNNCQTGMCPLSKDGKAYIVPCQSGDAPVGPTTLAEFTLQNTGPDFYDISMVNGANVPVSMEPTSSPSANPNNSSYWCSAPGSTKVSSGSLLSACDWTFDATIGGADHSSVLRAVTAGSTVCTDSLPCTKPEVCGYSFIVGTNTVTQNCGTPIGWWNADELCTFTGGAFGKPILCASTVKDQGTNTDLFQCTAVNSGSCYSANAGSDCCGCPTWTVNGQPLPLTPGKSCIATNNNWTSVAKPWAKFTKQACPTAYSFPYDDATSTFVCSTQASPTEKNPNAMNYKITFCPGGKTGF
ncbi:hypothetical protein AB7M35_003188 [Amorphus suaedae]